MSDVRIQRGLPATHRRTAALLYDEAFGAKLSAAITDAAVRIDLIDDSLDPDYAFVALERNQLLGLAGIHTEEGSLTAATDRLGFRHMTRRLGLPRTIRAAFILSMFERTARPGELLLDGIAVARRARGRGIGSMLLQTIASFAVREGYETVRLDVVNTNTRARALYERKGFAATETRRYPAIRNLLGFESSTTMILDLHSRP